MVRVLRRFADGFGAGDGYNLHDVGEWNSARKATVTKYFAEIDRLRSRPNYIFRGRDKEHIERAQEMSQHDPKFKRVKVAFVPFYEPSRGGPDPKARKIQFNKETIKTDAGYYKRTFVKFDARRLAKASGEEINRAADKVPGADVFAIKAGAFDMPNAYQRRGLSEKVQQLMNRYDGIKPLPSAYRSRRAIKGDADNPALHHWSRWLIGLVAYEFSGKPDPVRLLRDASRARDELKRKRAKVRRKLRGNKKSKGGKGDSDE